MPRTTIIALTVLVCVAGCVRDVSEDADTVTPVPATIGGVVVSLADDSATAFALDSAVIAALPEVGSLASAEAALQPLDPVSLPPTRQADREGTARSPARSGAKSPVAAAIPAPPATAPPPAVASAAKPTTSGSSNPPPAGLVATAAELETLGRAMIIPVQGITARQLRDTYTESRGSRVHEAIDILAPRGTPVTASVDGKLLKLFSSKAGGLMVYASDPLDRFVMMYGHLDRYADGLKEGMALRRGQVIGYVGTTGNAPVNTPHLHFAIGRGQPSKAWWRGTPVNPYPLLANK